MQEPKPQHQPSEVAVAATHALDVLDAAGGAEGRRIRAPALNAALDPLRRVPAVEVVCDPMACGRTIAWWALDPSEAYIAATERRAKPPALRRGGISDLARPERPTGRFLDWIELATSGQTTVRLVDFKNPSGFPLRLKFACRCGSDHTLKNTTRLRLFLRTLATGSGKIYL